MNTIAKLSLVAALLCGTARADIIDDAEKGRLVICDTQAQMERFVTVLESLDKFEEAIKKVNTEVKDPHACAETAGAFYRGNVVARANGPGVIFDVVRILAVAVQQRRGLAPVLPTVFFSAFIVDETGA